MNSNKFLKFLCSYPIIILALYFIPFLGICLFLTRYFLYGNTNKLIIIFIVVGSFILMPLIANLLLNYLSINFTFSDYIKIFVNSNFYHNNLLNLGKLLLIIGIVALILRSILNKLSIMIKNLIQKYLNKQQKRHDKILKDNDMRIKIMKEKVKNTNYVKCPNCGADNILTTKFGICKFCRSKLVNTNYKE